MAVPMNTTENKPMDDLKYIITNPKTKTEEEEIRTKFKFKLAGHIKKVRKEKGFSQEEIAFRSGLNSSYIGHLETGKYSPTLYVIWKITQAMGMTLQEFINDFF